MAPDAKQLARFVHVEPPAELDAWVRTSLLAAVAQQSPAAPRVAASATSRPGAAASSSSRERSRALPASAHVPLIERLTLAVGAVACGVQASAFVVRVVWSALTLGR